jgi:hypothetical protein
LYYKIGILSSGFQLKFCPFLLNGEEYLPLTQTEDVRECNTEEEASVKRRKQHENGGKELMSDRKTCGFCSLPNIMKVIKPKRLPWVGHIE